MIGVILAGGESSRMGKEKAFLDWKGQPLYKHMESLLQTFCNEIYISCNPNNIDAFSNISSISDYTDYLGNGPISGILSVMINTEGPWLFISCDLPLVNKSTLERLFYFRNANKTATVFVHLNTGIPEPLCAIYESNSKPALIKWFESGNTSMRLFLQNSNVEKILLKDTTELQSMNTPEQYEKLRLLN